MGGDSSKPRQELHPDLRMCTEADTEHIRQLVAEYSMDKGCTRLQPQVVTALNYIPSRVIVGRLAAVLQCSPPSNGCVEMKTFVGHLIECLETYKTGIAFRALQTTEKSLDKESAAELLCEVVDCALGGGLSEEGSAWVRDALAGHMFDWEGGDKVTLAVCTKSKALVWLEDVLSVFVSVALALACSPPDSEDDARSAFTSQVQARLSVPRLSLIPEEDYTLRDYTAFYLSRYLPHGCYAEEWECAFNSRSDGLAFDRFIPRIINKGPLLIVVSDEGGAVFGGFVAGGAQGLDPQFVGSGASFVFTLVPAAAVYRCAGNNTNFFYLNNGTESFPNGLGMGGQFDFFGLWIDSSFETGHSKGDPCSTFESPCLASSENFNVLEIEVWALDPSAASKLTADASILDKDNDVNILLDAMGKTRHSEGIRLPEDE